MAMGTMKSVIKRLRFPLEVMLVCVRWYVAYPLSLRNLEEMMHERGVTVDHSTIHRWILKLMPVLERTFRKRKAAVGTSWRMDETYIKVGGEWKYLYRAVDKAGDTVDFQLTAKRNRAAAQRFLTRAIAGAYFQVRGRACKASPRHQVPQRNVMTLQRIVSRPAWRFGQVGGPNAASIILGWLPPVRGPRGLPTGPSSRACPVFCPSPRRSLQNSAAEAGEYSREAALRPHPSKRAGTMALTTNHGVPVRGRSAAARQRAAGPP